MKLHLLWCQYFSKDNSTYKARENVRRENRMKQETYQMNETVAFVRAVYNLRSSVDVPHVT